MAKKHIVKLETISSLARENKLDWVSVPSGYIGSLLSDYKKAVLRAERAEANSQRLLRERRKLVGYD